MKVTQVFLYSCMLICWFTPAISQNAPQKHTSFTPGELWLDDQGQHINAHGGSIIKEGSKYYWYGEKRGGRASQGVNVYSSDDLYNWKFEKLALSPVDDSTHAIAWGCIIERPKVVYNEATKTYVMWFHLELRGQGYHAALAAVATSKTPTGPFQYVSSFRPNGNMSRDMTVYLDDDGSAYHIYASEDNYQLRISKLTADFLNPTTQDSLLFREHREAPAVFKHKGWYYLFTSGCTGWKPNRAALYRAKNLFGPWENMGDPMRGPHSEITFDGQSTFILPISGKPNAFVFMANRWIPNNLKDSRYLWLPIQLNESLPFVEWMDEWDLSWFDKAK